MKAPFAAAMLLWIAAISPAAAQAVSGSTPGPTRGGQAGTGVVTLPTLTQSPTAATSTTTVGAASTSTTTVSASGGASAGGGKGGASSGVSSSGSTGTGRSGGSGGQTMLCLPAGASVTEPFFDGTDLSCAP